MGTDHAAVGLQRDLPNQGRLRLPFAGQLRAGSGQFVIAVLIILLASYLMAPLVMMVVMAFNVAPDMLVPPYEFGLENWSSAWREPMLLESLWNSVRMVLSLLSLRILSVLVRLSFGMTEPPGHLLITLQFPITGDWMVHRNSYFAPTALCSFRASFQTKCCDLPVR